MLILEVRDERGRKALRYVRDMSDKKRAPTEQEISEWADGIVYRTARDGALLYFDPETRQWLPAPHPTKSTTSENTLS